MIFGQFFEKKTDFILNLNNTLQVYFLMMPKFIQKFFFKKLNIFRKIDLKLVLFKENMPRISTVFL